MIKQIVFVFFLFACSQSIAQTFKWAAQFGGPDYESGEDIVVDSSGNVYLLGILNGTGDFNPGAGIYNLTSAGAQDVYVVKLDSNGNFVWAARVGGSHQDFGYALALKGNSIYVCGNFKDTADFDPGNGIENLISAGGADIFILKLDTASNFGWALQIGGSGEDYAEKLILDNAGNLLICGEFQNTVDFNPGTGIQNLTSNGSADAYVLKLDSGGNYLWAGQFGNGPGQLAYGITTDASNAVYVTGLFYGTTDFDPGPAVFNLIASGFYSNVFVFRWSESGNFIWAKNIGNSSGGNFGSSIKTDGSGNLVVAGTFNGTVDFDPDPGVFNLTSTGSTGDIFVVKLTSLTGVFIFARGMGGPGLDQPYGLTLNAAGDIYLSGLFSLTADFDPGNAVFNLTASGSGDAFIVELDALGTFIWAHGFGGTDNDFSRGIKMIGSDLFTTGVFSYSADFDPGFSVYNLNSFSNSGDAFLLKLRFCTPVVNPVTYNICPGDSVFVAGAYHFVPGIYYDFYLSSGGCDSIVATTVQYTLTYNLGNDITVCSGQTVQLNTNITGATYLWSTGDTSSILYVTTSGNYWANVTINGCTVKDTINVHFNPLPSVNLGTDTLICTSATVMFNAGTGFASYLWIDGTTTSNFVFSGASGPGNYLISVMVTDSLGCSGNDSIHVIVISCPGIDEPELKSNHIQFYPNPLKDFFVIESKEKIKEIVLLNVHGQRVFHQFYNDKMIYEEQSFEAVSNGVYLLQVTSEGGILKTRIVIQH